MPSSASAGSKGIFKVGAVAMVQVKSVEITTNLGTYDVTVMSGLATPQWKAFISGLLDWTMKVSGFYDQANDAVQSTLWTNMTGGTVNAITYSPNTGTNNFTGNALLTQFDVKTDVAGVETIDLSFQGTGLETYA